MEIISPIIDPVILDKWCHSMDKVVSEIDVSNLKEGEILNINESSNRNEVGDLGVDNKKSVYRFMGNKQWKYYFNQQ